MRELEVINMVATQCQCSRLVLMFINILVPYKLKKNKNLRCTLVSRLGFPNHKIINVSLHPFTYSIVGL